jgi:hypothetical protein
VIHGFSDSTNDHSASRRLEVVQAEAPHLIADEPEAEQLRGYFLLLETVALAGIAGAFGGILAALLVQVLS